MKTLFTAVLAVATLAAIGCTKPEQTSLKQNRVSVSDTDVFESIHWKDGYSTGYGDAVREYAPRSIPQKDDSVKVTKASFNQYDDGPLIKEWRTEVEDSISDLRDDIDDIKKSIDSEPVASVSASSAPDCDCGENCKCKSQVATASAPTAMASPPVVLIRSAPPVVSSGSSGNSYSYSGGGSNGSSYSYSGGSNGNGYSSVMDSSSYFASGATSYPSTFSSGSGGGGGGGDFGPEPIYQGASYSAPGSRVANFIRRAPIRTATKAVLSKCLD